MNQNNTHIPHLAYYAGADAGPAAGLAPRPRPPPRRRRRPSPRHRTWSPYTLVFYFCLIFLKATILRLPRVVCWIVKQAGNLVQ